MALSKDVKLRIQRNKIRRATVRSLYPRRPSRFNKIIDEFKKIAQSTVYVLRPVDPRHFGGLVNLDNQSQLPPVSDAEFERFKQFVSGGFKPGEIPVYLAGNPAGKSIGAHAIMKMLKTRSGQDTAKFTWDIEKPLFDLGLEADISSPSGKDKE